MARLDDIPKKDFFSTPPDYFEKLPAQILSQVQSSSRAHPKYYPVLRYSLQYALPLVLIAAALFFYEPEAPDAETLLASVETEELIDYLQETGISTEDLIETIDFSTADLEEIENEIYGESLPTLDSASIDL